MTDPHFLHILDSVLSVLIIGLPIAALPYVAAMCLFMGHPKGRWNAKAGRWE